MAQGHIEVVTFPDAPQPIPQPALNKTPKYDWFTWLAGAGTSALQNAAHFAASDLTEGLFLIFTPSLFFLPFSQRISSILPMISSKGSFLHVSSYTN